MEWKPIETAPRNAETILIARFDDDGSYWSACAEWWVNQFAICAAAHLRHGYTPITLCFEPTHWMPLPEPPKK